MGKSDTRRLVTNSITIATYEERRHDFLNEFHEFKHPSRDKSLTQTMSRPRIIVTIPSFLNSGTYQIPVAAFYHITFAFHHFSRNSIKINVKK